MELITILNHCHRFRGFVYEHAYFSADKKSIEVVVRPRKGSAAVCSRCHLPAPGYDQLAERLWSGFISQEPSRNVRYAFVTSLPLSAPLYSFCGQEIFPDDRGWKIALGGDSGSGGTPSPCTSTGDARSSPVGVKKENP